MKYPTMRFVFDRKKVATKTHKGLVQIEVLSEGKRKWIGTGVKVYSDQWNDRKKIINSVEMIQLNQCLDEQLRIIQNCDKHIWFSIQINFRRIRRAQTL